MARRIRPLRAPSSLHPDIRGAAGCSVGLGSGQRRSLPARSGRPRVARTLALRNLCSLGRRRSLLPPPSLVSTGLGARPVSCVLKVRAAEPDQRRIHRERDNRENPAVTTRVMILTDLTASARTPSSDTSPLLPARFGCCLSCARPGDIRSPLARAGWLRRKSCPG